MDENFRLLKTVKNVEIFLNLSRAAVRKCGPRGNCDISGPLQTKFESFQITIKNKQQQKNRSSTFYNTCDMNFRGPKQHKTGLKLLSTVTITQKRTYLYNFRGPYATK